MRLLFDLSEIIKLSIFYQRQTVLKNVFHLFLTQINIQKTENRSTNRLVLAGHKHFWFILIFHCYQIRWTNKNNICVSSDTPNEGDTILMKLPKSVSQVIKTNAWDKTSSELSIYLFRFVPTKSLYFLLNKNYNSIIFWCNEFKLYYKQYNI